MKAFALAFCLLCTGPAAIHANAQEQTAQDLKSASPATIPGETDEQHGKRLLDQMLVALGGDAWLHRTNVYTEGSVASFFRGQPTGSVVRFVEWKQLATPSSPELDRYEFLTLRGMIKPGMKRDIAHLWTANQGYELTYKGVTTLPKPQVEDYIRRRSHTLDEMMRALIHQPGVAIVATGSGMRDRQPVDKVTVLTANNDAVSVEIDQNTHLPSQRSFEWRNPQFKDHDLDEEVYGDWRMIQGIATPMNMTRYKNGDMVSQTFYTRILYNEPIAPDLFNPERPLVKK